MNYNGAVFIVSHDRFFLNRVVTKVIEIENGALSMYMGNYRAYSEKKQQIRDAKLKEYFNQQREIKHQQAVIEKLPLSIGKNPSAGQKAVKIIRKNHHCR